MRQDEFGYRIRQALDEGAQRLDYSSQLRLQRARAKALARQRLGPEAPVWVPALQTASAAARAGEVHPAGWIWLRRFALLVSLATLVIGFLAIDDWQQVRSIRESANLDFAVLLDEGPLDAFADQGFGVLLRVDSEQPRF